MAQKKTKSKATAKKTSLKVVESTPPKKKAKKRVVSRPSPSRTKTKTEVTKPSTTAEATNFFTQFNMKEIMMNMNNTKNFEKMSQEAANVGKETMEACQKSASILAKNSQACMTSYMAMLQSAAEKQSRLMKDMLGKKTINEMSETLQSASQESFSEAMENMSKLSEQSIKAMMDCCEPLNTQMNKAAKKASDMAA